MAKEKKLGVTSYIKDPEKVDSAIYCRITYDRKKIEIKSPTFNNFKGRISQFGINEISTNDKRILERVKFFYDEKKVPFELSYLKTDLIQKFYTPIVSSNQEFFLKILSKKLKKQYPETSRFLKKLSSNKSIKFLRVLQEVNPELYNNAIEDSKILNDEFLELVMRYSSENNYIYLSVADLMVDPNLREYVSNNSNKAIQKRFLDFTSAWNPGLEIINPNLFQF